MTAQIRLAAPPRIYISAIFDNLGLRNRSVALNAVLERASLYAYGDRSSSLSPFSPFHIFESMLNSPAEEQTRFIQTVNLCGMDVARFGLTFTADGSRHLRAAEDWEESPNKYWHTGPDDNARRILEIATDLAKKAGDPVIDTVHVFIAMLQLKGYSNSAVFAQWFRDSNMTESVFLKASRQLNSWQCSLDTIPMSSLGHAGPIRGYPPIATVVGGKQAESSLYAKHQRLGFMGSGFVPSIELFTPLGVDITRCFLISQTLSLCVYIAMTFGIIEIIHSGHPWWALFGLILPLLDTSAKHPVFVLFHVAAGAVVLILAGMLPWVALPIGSALFQQANKALILVVQRRETRNPRYGRADMRRDIMSATLRALPRRKQ